MRNLLTKNKRFNYCLWKVRSIFFRKKKKDKFLNTILNVAHCIISYHNSIINYVVYYFLPLCVLCIIFYFFLGNRICFFFFRKRKKCNLFFNTVSNVVYRNTSYHVNHNIYKWLKLSEWFHRYEISICFCLSNLKNCFFNYHFYMFNSYFLIAI